MSLKHAQELLKYFTMRMKKNVYAFKFKFEFVIPIEHMSLIIISISHVKISSKPRCTPRLDEQRNLALASGYPGIIKDKKTKTYDPRDRDNRPWPRG